MAIPFDTEVEDASMPETQDSDVAVIDRTIERGDEPRFLVAYPRATYSRNLLVSHCSINAKGAIEDGSASGITGKLLFSALFLLQIIALNVLASLSPSQVLATAIIIFVATKLLCRIIGPLCSKVDLLVARWSQKRMYWWAKRLLQFSTWCAILWLRFWAIVISLLIAVIALLPHKVQYKDQDATRNRR